MNDDLNRNRIRNFCLYIVQKYFQNNRDGGLKEHVYDESKNIRDNQRSKVYDDLQRKKKN